MFSQLISLINGGDSDTVPYISYTTLDPNISVSIDGGSETSDFDWIILIYRQIVSIDFGLMEQL